MNVIYNNVLCYCLDFRSVQTAGYSGTEIRLSENYLIFSQVEWNLNNIRRVPLRLKIFRANGSCRCFFIHFFFYLLKGSQIGTVTENHCNCRAGHTSYKMCDKNITVQRKNILLSRRCEIKQLKIILLFAGKNTRRCLGGQAFLVTDVSAVIVINNNPAPRRASRIKLL